MALRTSTARSWASARRGNGPAPSGAKRYHVVLCGGRPVQPGRPPAGLAPRDRQHVQDDGRGDMGSTVRTRASGTRRRRPARASHEQHRTITLVTSVRSPSGQSTPTRSRCPSGSPVSGMGAVAIMSETQTRRESTCGDQHAVDVFLHRVGDRVSRVGNSQAPCGARPATRRHPRVGTPIAESASTSKVP